MRRTPCKEELAGAESDGRALEQDGDFLPDEFAVARDGRCAAAGGIPYQIARGVEFYGRKEIKDVLAYLRVIANPADQVSLERIVNVPTRGIGDESMKLLEAFAVGNGLAIWEAFLQRGEIEGLSTRAQGAVASFVRMIEGFAAQRRRSRAVCSR